MPMITTTTITCDQCGTSLEATDANTTPFLVVQNALRMDATGEPVMAEPTLPDSLYVCNESCLKLYAAERL